jgi:hypothetical protein
MPQSALQSLSVASESILAVSLPEVRAKIVTKVLTRSGEKVLWGSGGGEGKVVMEW